MAMETSMENEATVLDKEEIRRKRNRISAERSRLKLQDRIKNLELEKESEMHRQASLERYVSELKATKVKLRQSFVSHKTNCVRKYRRRQAGTVGLDQLVPGPKVMQILPSAKHQSRKVPKCQSAKQSSFGETEVVLSNGFLSISQSESSSNIPMHPTPNISVQLTGTECKFRNSASLGAAMPAQVVPQTSHDLMSIAPTTGSQWFSLNVSPHPALPIVSSTGHVTNTPGSTDMTTEYIRILSEDEEKALRLSSIIYGHIPVINIAQNTTTMPFSNNMSNTVTNSDTCQSESVLQQTKSDFSQGNGQDNNCTDVLGELFRSLSHSFSPTDDGGCLIDILLGDTESTESGQKSVLTKDRSDSRFSCTGMSFIDYPTVGMCRKAHGNHSASTALPMDTMVPQSSLTTAFKAKDPPKNDQAMLSAAYINKDSASLLEGIIRNTSAEHSLRRFQLSSDQLGTNDLTIDSTCMSNWTTVNENKNNSSALMENGGSELPEDILEMSLSHNYKCFISTYDDALDFLRH